MKLLANRNILVIDHYGEILDYFRGYIESHGGTPFLVSNCEEASQLLKMHKFDFVFCDVFAKDKVSQDFMNNVESCSKGKTKHVLMSGSSFLDKNQLEGSGMDHCLQKPFNRKDLDKIFQAALNDDNQAGQFVSFNIFNDKSDDIIFDIYNKEVNKIKITIYDIGDDSFTFYSAENFLRDNHHFMINISLGNEVSNGIRVEGDVTKLELNDLNEKDEEDLAQKYKGFFKIAADQIEDWKQFLVYIEKRQLDIIEFLHDVRGD